MRELQLVLTPAVESVTPPSVWRASNAMNYAFVKSLAQLLDRPELTRPYRHTEIRRLGEDLLRIADPAHDEGLSGDRRVTDAWASLLGFSDWYQ